MALCCTDTLGFFFYQAYIGYCGHVGNPRSVVSDRSRVSEDALWSVIQGFSLRPPGLWSSIMRLYSILLERGAYIDPILLKLNPYGVLRLQYFTCDVPPHEFFGGCHGHPGLVTQCVDLLSVFGVQKTTQVRQVAYPSVSYVMINTCIKLQVDQYEEFMLISLKFKLWFTPIINR